MTGLYNCGLVKHIYGLKLVQGMVSFLISSKIILGLRLQSILISQKKIKDIFMIHVGSSSHLNQIAGEYCNYYYYNFS